MSPPPALTSSRRTAGCYARGTSSGGSGSVDRREICWRLATSGACHGLNSHRRVDPDLSLIHISEP
ncbi:hypothetical protein, partial [Mycobacterium tuberculosis]|uniref:hypothetical protein n=1 Tax=Mycobacterium tuberculosis TaxID=1773 RepID=UPI001BA6B911